MSLAHVIAEVFADTPLQGNQLAVFEDGPALSGDQMQRLPCALRVRDLSGCGHPPGDGRPGVESQQRFYSGRGPARWIRPRVVMMAPL